MSACITHAESVIFNYPFGITISNFAVDNSGNIYVVDNGNDCVEKFDSNWNLITKWGSRGSGDGQFHGAGYITTDYSGNVYVADGGNHRIQKFTSDGKFITKWGSYGTGDGQFNGPGGVAFDFSGNIYVAENDGCRIQKFSSDGKFITKWGSKGSDNGQFLYPYNVAVDHSGNVYVVDTTNDRIQKFTSDGRYITQWGSYGNGDGQFFSPCGIAIDSSGIVYIADSYNNRIETFTSNGDFISKWGSYGSDYGQFNWPYGIAVDSTGNVYVADTRNYRIQVEPFVNGIPVVGAVPISVGIPHSHIPKSPSITWSNPDDIIFGTPLSNIQLNAAASYNGNTVHGSFVYLPKLGTVLNAGQQQKLRVWFYPADQYNYYVVEKVVLINVLTPVQKTQQITTSVQSLNLDEGLANSLIVKLDAAIQNMNNENSQAATGVLNAFINEVEADIQNGKLTSTEGQALIKDANTVINAINHISNPPSTSVPEFPSVVLPVVAVLGLVAIIGRRKE